ncbi:MAG TPA: FMN-binding negative transcriptional regulator [Candidatus Limnocylindrales bacterium]|nr:FMN-binding negative transcriptional regulator [Candidatus Limnocylindrales bacterium]
MYVPEYFKPDDGAVRELLRNHGAVDLVTATPSGLRATMLPMIYVEGTAGGPDRLLGHVARKNDHWRQPVVGDALAIVRGPDAYITPSWYSTKREHGRVVPTWNYITAHVHGELVVHEDVEWLEANVRQLTAKHEAGREEPWSVDDAPAQYVAGQLRAIVGLELLIGRIEAKFKLSQNRSADDVAGVVSGLVEVGRPDISESVRAASRQERR